MKSIDNKCIIIGNASNNLGKGLRKHIDSFENVVRFNRFHTEEFQKEISN